jgi:isopenicillin N synthase-like dioxygenase
MQFLSAALGGATLPTVAGGESISFTRVFHYLSADQSADVARHAPRIGSSPHTDWHVVTIIVQDTAGGLQVLSPDGRWRNVPACRGEVIALFGDYLAVGSGGRVRSVIHRVRLPRRCAAAGQESGRCVEHREGRCVKHRVAGRTPWRTQLSP